MRAADLFNTGREDYVRADVRNYRQMEKLFAGDAFDYVYHLAAEYGRWNGEAYEIIMRTFRQRTPSSCTFHAQVFRNLALGDCCARQDPRSRWCPRHQQLRDMSECSQISCRDLCGKITACAQLKHRLERTNNCDDIALLRRLRQEDRVGVVEPFERKRPHACRRDAP